MKPYIFIHRGCCSDCFMLIHFSIFETVVIQKTFQRILPTNLNHLLSRQDSSRWQKIGDGVTKGGNGLLYLGACVTALPSSCWRERPAELNWLSKLPQTTLHTSSPLTFLLLYELVERRGRKKMQLQRPFRMSSLSCMKAKTEQLLL